MFKMSALSHQVDETKQVIQDTAHSHTTNIRKSENTSEKFKHEASADKSFDQVVLRPKTRTSELSSAKTGIGQSSQRSASSYKQSVSMLDVSHSKPSSRLNDLRKSFTTDSKQLPPLRTLSALRPLSASTSDLSRLRIADNGRPVSESFSSRSFLSRSSMISYPKKRQQDGNPFQVDVLKGITGIGLKVKVTSEGHARITDIQSGGPVDKNGQVRVGDYILFVNSTSLTGQSDARVQQVMRLLPRGLTKLVITNSNATSASKLHLHEKNSFPVQNQSIESQRMSHSSTSHKNKISDLENGTDVHEVKDVPQVQPLMSSMYNAVESTVIHTNNGSTVKDTPIQREISQVPPAQASEYHVEHPQVVLRHGYTSSVEEVPKEFEHTISRGIQSVDDPKIVEKLAESVTAENDQSITAENDKPPSQRHDDLSTSLSHYSNVMSNNTDLFHLNDTVKSSSAGLSNMKTDTHITAESSPKHDTDSSHASSPASSPQLLVSLHDVDQKQSQYVSSTRKIMESNINNEKPENVVSRQRVSTFEAMTHVSHPNSSIQPENSVHNAERINTKSQQIRSTGYEQLQAISRESKTSPIVENHRAFVSSTAKLFDLKSANDKAILEQAAPTKRRPISLNINSSSDSGNEVNKSSQSIHDRWKHIESTSPSYTLTKTGSLPSPSRLRSINSTAAIPQRITKLESSRRIGGSVDNLSKIGMPSTQLNSALFPIKHESTWNKQTTDKIIRSKNDTVEISDTYRVDHADTRNTEYSDMYKSTTVTLPDKKSLSDIESPYDYNKSLYVDFNEQYNQSSTSLIQPLVTQVSSQSTADVFDDTTSKFNELLTDSSFKQMTDPHGMLFQSHDSIDSSLPTLQNVSMESANNSQSKMFEIESQVAYQNNVAETKMKNEIINEKNRNKTNKTNKQELESVDGGFKQIMETRDVSHTDVSKGVNAETANDLVSEERNNDSTDSSNSLYGLDNAPARPTAIKKTLNTINRDSIEQRKIADTVLETSESGDNYSSDNNTMLPDFQELEQTKVVIAQDKDNEKTIHKIIHKTEMNSVVFNSVSVDFNSDDQIEEWKVNNAHKKNMNHEKSSELVENVIINFENIQEMSQIDKSASFFEAVSPSLSDEEAPPLPGAPPPFIFKDESLLVDTHELKNHNYSSVVPVSITGNIPGTLKDHDLYIVVNQSATSNTIPMDVNRHKEEFAVAGLSATVEEQVNKADSIEHLNSTGDSFDERDFMQACSLNSMDILSEDSGMPADEDQEMVTDDAISPPGEFAEKAFMLDPLNNIMLLSDTKADPVSPKNESGQSASAFATLQVNTTTILDVAPLNKDNMLNVEDGLDNDIASDDLPPPMLPSSLPPNVISVDDITFYNEDLTFEDVSIVAHTSDVQPEIDLLGNDIPLFETNILVPMALDNKSNIRSKVTNESTSNLYITSTTEDKHKSINSPYVYSTADVINSQNTNSVTEVTEYFTNISDVNINAEVTNRSINIPNSTSELKISKISTNILDSNITTDIKKSSTNSPDTNSTTDVTKEPTNSSDTNFAIDVTQTSTNSPYSNSTINVTKISSNSKNTNSTIDVTKISSNSSDSNSTTDLTKKSTISPDTSSTTDVTKKSTNIPYTNSTTDLTKKSTNSSDTNSTTDVTKKSTNSSDTNSASRNSVGNAGRFFEKRTVSGPLNKPLASVTSKRKWCLRSNKYKSTMLAETYDTHAGSGYTDEAVFTVLPRSDLIYLIDRANAVLDTMSDQINLFLMIIHLYNDEHFVSLGIELKHEGGSLLKVLDIKKGSLVYEEGGAKVGDWLLAIDNLWCDQVNMRRFMSRITMPKHDTILVLARQENSAKTSNAQENILNSTIEISPANKRIRKSSDQEHSLLLDNVAITTVNSPASVSEVYATLSGKPEIIKAKSPMNKQDDLTFSSIISSKPEIIHVKSSKTEESEASLSATLSSKSESVYVKPSTAGQPQPTLSATLSSKSESVYVKPSTAGQPHQSTLSATLSSKPESVHVKPSTAEQSEPTLSEIVSSKSESVHIKLSNTEKSEPTISEIVSSKPETIHVKSSKTEQAQPNLVSKKNVPVEKQHVLNEEKSTTEIKRSSVKREYIKDAQENTSRISVQESSLNVKILQEHLPVEIISSNSSGTPVSGAGVHKVVMTKGATGVGFCLEGGIGSPKGDLPITIKRIFKGGPAEKCGLLKVNDEILEVNGLKFSTMRHYEAWNHLKSLQDGEVHISIHRK